MSVLFDGREAATPTQRARHAERTARLERMVGTIAVKDRPVVCLSASVRSATFQFSRPEPVAVELPPTQPALPPPEIAVKWAPFVVPETLPLKRPSTRQVQREVLKHFAGDITMMDLLSSRRTAAVVLPRQIAMYVAKAVTDWSLPAIGRQFGGRDHTTVLHAVRKITALIHSDPDLAQTVGEVINDLGCQDV